MASTAMAGATEEMILPTERWRTARMVVMAFIGLMSRGLRSSEFESRFLLFFGQILFLFQHTKSLRPKADGKKYDVSLDLFNMHHPEEANSFITLCQISDMTSMNTVSNHFDNFLNAHMTLFISTLTMA
jgi:hypothetical protein